MIEGVEAMKMNESDAIMLLSQNYEAVVDGGCILLVAKLTEMDRPGRRASDWNGPTGPARYITYYISMRMYIYLYIT